MFLFKSGQSELLSGTSALEHKEGPVFVIVKETSSSETDVSWLCFLLCGARKCATRESV
jgi:hypothetical protein